MENFVRKNRSLANKVQSPQIFEEARKHLDTLMQKKTSENQVFKSVVDVLLTFSRLTKDSTYSDLVDPVPLRAFVKILDEISNGIKHRYIIGIPAQHGKTLLSLCGLILFCIKKPGSRNIYCTYSIDRADTIKKFFIEVITTLGFAHTEYKGVIKFANSSVKFCGPTQVTGNTCTGLFVADDLYVGYQQAQSETERKNISTIVFSDVHSRSQGGCSFLFVGTRFHKNDVQSELLNAKMGFQNLTIPALCTDPINDPAGRTEIDQVLWEDRKSKQFCIELRNAKPIIFQCMYQNDPGSVGCNYFKDPHYYADRNVEHIIKRAGGVDFGYSSTGDYCTYIELIQTPTEIRVNKTFRQLCTFEEFASELQKIAIDIPLRLYGTAQEVTLCSFLKNKGLNINGYITNKPKAERALSTYPDWNIGKILYPGDDLQSPTDATVLYEIMQFNGDKRNHDDCVDSLVCAYDELMSQSVSLVQYNSEQIEQQYYQYQQSIGV